VDIGLGVLEDCRLLLPVERVAVSAAAEKLVPIIWLPDIGLLLVIVHKI
jgi:hypothetical protein